MSIVIPTNSAKTEPFRERNLLGVSNLFWGMKQNPEGLCFHAKRDSLRLMVDGPIHCVISEGSGSPSVT